jgi:carboxymethylenebutenolidase
VPCGSRRARSRPSWPQWCSAPRAADFTRGPDAAFQFHLAEQDDSVAAAALKRMERALHTADRRSESWSYPGARHWFFEPDRPEYDAKAAALAWTRMLAFLRKETATRPTARRPSRR